MNIEKNEEKLRLFRLNHNDAATISNSLFLEKADIILDCMGALWYALNEYNVEEVKS